MVRGIGQKLVTEREIFFSLGQERYVVMGQKYLILTLLPICNAPQVFLDIFFFFFFFFFFLFLAYLVTID